MYTRAPLQPIAGFATRARSLAAPTALRLRPGERPFWLNMSLQRLDVVRWRERAASWRLGVDAWLGILLEYQLVATALRAIADEGLLARVIDAARQATSDERLPPTPELRLWLRQLGGASPKHMPDDLPSIVVAERLIMQVAPSERVLLIATAALSNAEDDAICLDRAAALVGHTMSAWAYLAALEPRRRPSAG